MEPQNSVFMEDVPPTSFDGDLPDSIDHFLNIDGPITYNTGSSLLLSDSPPAESLLEAVNHVFVPCHSSEAKMVFSNFHDCDDELRAPTAETVLDGSRKRKLRQPMDEIDLEDEALIGEEDLWDPVADDSSTTDLISISSEFNYYTDSSSNISTSAEPPLCDINYGDANPPPSDPNAEILASEHWKSEWSTMLMVWALKQAQLRALERNDPNYVYTHLPLPDISHYRTGVNALDPIVTPRLVPKPTGGPRTKLVFCSWTPPATGSSIYSKPCPVPFHGSTRESKKIDFRSADLYAGVDVFKDWLAPESYTKLSKPVFNAFQPSSLIGAVVSSGNRQSTISLFTWKTPGSKDYLGRRNQKSYRHVRLLPREPGPFRRSLTQLGQWNCSNEMKRVNGLIWTSNSSLLVYGDSNGLPAFELHSFDVNNPSSTDHNSCTLINLPVTANLRDITEGKTQQVTFAGFDDGTVLSISNEHLGTSKCAKKQHWTFDGPVGSIRLHPERHAAFSVTLDEVVGSGHLGSVFNLIDTRQSTNSNPALSLNLDRLVYSHDYGWNHTILCGDSLGFVTFYDDRKLTSSYHHILKDHSNSAIGDVRFNRDTDIILFAGSPSCSFWKYSEQDILKHAGNTMVDEGFLRADHLVHASFVPGTSLGALSSSAGTLALVDL